MPSLTHNAGDSSILDLSPEKIGPKFVLGSMVSPAFCAQILILAALGRGAGGGGGGVNAAICCLVQNVKACNRALAKPVITSNSTWALFGDVSS